MGLQGSLDRIIRKHLNFYRVHLLYVTFTPLIASAIFYAANGQNHIAYIDCLFVCISAMAVCGLATIDLSSCTTVQQVILFCLMCVGSPVFVSWFIVYFRRYYFAKKFSHLIAAAAARRSNALLLPVQPPKKPWYHRVKSFVTGRPKESTIRKVKLEEKSNGVRPDMIRRVDDAPKLVDPSGWISHGSAPPSPPQQPRHLSFVERSLSSERRARPSEDRSLPRVGLPRRRRLSRRLSDPGVPPTPGRSPVMSRFETMHHLAPTTPVSPSHTRTLNRTQTIEFAAPTIRRRGRSETVTHELRSVDGHPTTDADRRSTLRPHTGVPLTAYGTMHSYATERRTKLSGFGGFPMPHEIIMSIFNRLFPTLRPKLSRTLTVPATTTITSIRDSTHDGARPVPYVSFPAVVGRNSTFQLRDYEQLEELGGVEYRALNALLYILPVYHFGLQLLGFVIVAPYMANRFNNDFVPPALHRPLSHTWFSLFQVVSAYTNTGMSLVDQSMSPFQEAYPLLLVMIFLILAGNTCFPIFLRFTIWILTKVVPKQSRLNETLHFLLDHPRRCYILLFPSHQTWFLLTVVIFLNSTDWFFFMILDIGTPAIEAIQLGTRFLIGLFQALAVRASGFSAVSVAALAPAVKVLYVIMMYVSVYPIAMSVRSTNVYEEQSLGIFHQDEEPEEDNFQPTGNRVAVWSSYLTLHARRQLSFDMWWLGLALFLMCIIERPGLEDEANAVWFNIFTLIFELTSGYGTVGLSLGSPDHNFSLAGVLHPASKAIFCIVMLRGRHRGLPVAIDRAIMLPGEFREAEHAYEVDQKDTNGLVVPPELEEVFHESPLGTLQSVSSAEEQEDGASEGSRTSEGEQQVSSSV